MSTGQCNAHSTTVSLTTTIYTTANSLSTAHRPLVKCHRTLKINNNSNKKAEKCYNAGNARQGNISPNLGEGVPLWGAYWSCQRVPTGRVHKALRYVLAFCSSFRCNF